MINRTFKVVLVILGGLFVGLVGVFVWVYFAYLDTETANIRYRLEVILEVDGEPQTYSTVQELRLRETESFLSSAEPVSRRIIGQALIIEVDDLDPIIVTMAVLGGRPDAVSINDLFLEACNVPKRFPGQPAGDYVKSTKFFEGRCQVPDGTLPIFLRFLDSGDDKEMFWIDPLNLKKSYSPRVGLLGVFMETTDEPISENIIEKMPWLESMTPAEKGMYLGFELDGKRISLSDGDFNRRQ